MVRTACLGDRNAVAAGIGNDGASVLPNVQRSALCLVRRHCVTSRKRGRAKPNSCAASRRSVEQRTDCRASHEHIGWRSKVLTEQRSAKLADACASRLKHVERTSVLVNGANKANRQGVVAQRSTCERRIMLDARCV